MKGYARCLFHLAVVGIVAIAGCLSFGEDLELTGTAIDKEIFRKVTMLTGVSIPSDARGLNYFYYGSGIDDALAIKFSVPEQRRTEFLKNNIFADKSNADMQDPFRVTDKSWWREAELHDAIRAEIWIDNNTQFVRCSLGEEMGDLVVYLAWQEL